MLPQKVRKEQGENQLTCDNEIYRTEIQIFFSSVCVYKYVYISDWSLQIQAKQLCNTTGSSRLSWDINYKI